MKKLMGTAAALVLAVTAVCGGAAAFAYEDEESEEEVVDTTALPVGDDSVTDHAGEGLLWSCQTTFNGGGAMVEGDWFNGDGTYNLEDKAVIDGEVSWPGEFEITVDGDTRTFTGNDLPADHTTGEFPVSEDDDAYAVDRNPNSISEQTINVEVPTDPTVADEPSCTPGGPIGVLLSGVLLYNPTDAAGRDAVAWEVQDSCQGHPQQAGEYHYHNVSDCIEDTQSEADDHSDLVGYAFDGFGIYGHYGEDGEVVTNEDLDECHGHTHEIEWDGETVELYHYHATYEFPYVIGCFKGEAAVTGPAAGGGAGAGGTDGAQPPTGGQPPAGGPPPMGPMTAVTNEDQ